MTPSGSSNHPQVTLKPCVILPNESTIFNIQYSVSAFNIFVLVYREQFKHWGVVRDLALKLGDWFWAWKVPLGSNRLVIVAKSIHYFSQTTAIHQPIPYATLSTFLFLFSHGCLLGILGGKMLWVSIRICLTNVVPSTQEANVPFKTILEGLLVKGKGSVTQVAGTSQPTSNPSKGRLAWQFSQTGVWLSSSSVSNWLFLFSFS